LIKNYFLPGGTGDKEIILNHFREFITNDPDVVLISAYTMYLDVVRDICQICFEQNIPVIIGGSAFVETKIAKLWASIVGVSAVYAGEPEFQLMEIINDLINGRCITKYPGVYSRERGTNQLAAPLAPLDNIAIPDFSDFPWNLYPNRVIPIMTGRGCGWDICTFCSDVTTASGRTFRSRSIESVLVEIKHQCSRFDANLIAFLDLKLNSDVHLWRELINQIPIALPNVLWTASIHIDTRKENGLSRDELFKARASGLVRVTCGLESGSPKVLKLMAKGIKLKRLSTFLKNAHDAGISVRMTCIIGYPGEEPADVDLTTQFIIDHKKYIERIVLNRFALMPNTPIAKKLENQGNDFPYIQTKELDLHTGIIHHKNQKLATIEYSSAAFRLMKTIHKVNLNPLMKSAVEFEGVM